VQQLKKTLMQLDDVAVPELSELEEALGDYYDTALTVDAAGNNYLVQYNQLTETAFAKTFFRANGKAILEKIRRFVCKIITATSSQDEILEAILKAISSIIPGGIIAEAIVKKLIKFFFSKGFNQLCPVPVGK
jgi:hypothetical protein